VAGNWLFIGVRWLNPLDASDRGLLENNIDALMLACPILARAFDRGHLLQSVLDVSSAWARHAADSDDRQSLADRHLPAPRVAPLSMLSSTLPANSNASSDFHFGQARSVSHASQASQATAEYAPGTVTGGGRTAGHIGSFESAPAGADHGRINAGQAVDAVLPLLGPLRGVAGRVGAGGGWGGVVGDSVKDLCEQVWGPAGGDGEGWEQGRQPAWEPDSDGGDGEDDGDMSFGGEEPMDSDCDSDTAGFRGQGGLAGAYLGGGASRADDGS
jgi:hypothetical protein